MAPTTEHKRLLSAYTAAARQTVDAMVALLAFEDAAREVGNRSSMAKANRLVSGRFNIVIDIKYWAHEAGAI